MPFSRHALDVAEQRPDDPVGVQLRLLLGEDVRAEDLFVQRGERERHDASG